MQAQVNKLLILLVLLTGAVWAAASIAPIERRIWITSRSNVSSEDYVWKNELLRDWDNGWDIDIDDEPLDPNTACFGEPCIKTKLKKPSFNNEFELCITSSGFKYICESLPEGAILLEGDEDDYNEDKDDYNEDDDYNQDLLNSVFGCQ